MSKKSHRAGSIVLIETNQTENEFQALSQWVGDAIKSELKKP